MNVLTAPQMEDLQVQSVRGGELGCLRVARTIPSAGSAVVADHERTARSGVRRNTVSYRRRG